MSITKLISKYRTIFIVLAILIISAVLAFLVLWQRAKNIEERISGNYIKIQPTAPHTKSSILVRFKKPYNPFYLQKEITRRQSLKPFPFRPVLLAEDVWNYTTDKNNPEQTLEYVNRTLQEIGIISYRKIDKDDIEELNASFKLNIPDDTDIAKFQDKLGELGFFESSEPDFEMEISAVPNDPNYSQLWGMQKIQAPLAWDIFTGSKNVVVAVIDSGSEPTHPDLAANMVAGKNMLTGGAINDGNGHGTHVAGTIGAVGNNSIGVAGLNWNVSIMPLQVFGASGRGDSGPIYEAISYAVANGAKVINMSIGNEEGYIPCTPNTEYARRISYAVSKGVVVVVAAGNENRDAAGTSPASCEDAIAVGATDSSDNRSIWSSTGASNYGNHVSIAAPGTGIFSTWKLNIYKSSNGTSMASPHVAGAAALLLSENPSLSPAQVKNCLIQNGDPITTDQPIGGVRLNIFKALQACANLTLPTGGASTPTPTISSGVPTPTLVLGVPTPTPTVTTSPTVPPDGGLPDGTPTPTPETLYNCRLDPVCIKSGKSIQLCPLICTPQL